jgi:hypothetical protein
MMSDGLSDQAALVKNTDMQPFNRVPARSPPGNSTDRINGIDRTRK